MSTVCFAEEHVDEASGSPDHRHAVHPRAVQDDGGAAHRLR